MRAPVLATVLGLALGGCAQEYGLSSVPDEVAAATPARPARQGRDRATPTSPPRATGAPSGSAVVHARPGRAPVGRPAPPDQVVPLGGGAAVDAVDFLFVVDGSSSMKHVIDRVFGGFDALAAEGVFPRDARIGITSMTPTDPDLPGEPHWAVHHRKEQRRDPGFAGLVDGRRIDRYVRKFPEHLEAWAMPGCDAWFSPTARNREGEPCLVAHTQSSLLGVGVEAGLTTVGQLLEGPPLFRTGAAVNVIFVSDTQDPGLGPTKPGFEELDAARPTGPALAAAAAATQDIAGFRLHAITPASGECGEPWAHVGDVYGDAARATGGLTLDVCSAEPDDYVALIRRILREGAVPTAGVVRLASAEPVAGVTVDGEPVAFHLSRDHKAVILDGGLPAHRRDVRVQYGSAAARSVQPLVGGPARALE